ncbi:phospholipase D family protein [Shewanella algae]|uniref:phospholipase D family protein n=1 Tax=Shewanella algae TaxID=38313 RepID=UPI000695A656
MIAVAYWGKGADELLYEDRNYKIICNFTDGGTNPATIDCIQRMENVQIRHLERLHAKVVIGSKYTIVGSANFSENGLGYGSATKAGQYEAAVQIDTEDSFSHWFDELWSMAKQITFDDFQAADKQWAVRSCNGRGTDDTYHAELEEPKEKLLMHDLLLDEITGKNRTLMATKVIVERYKKAFNLDDDSYSQTAARYPAHAANLIWVVSGGTAKVALEHISEFSTPSEVFYRMEELRTTKKVLEFLNWLKDDKTLKESVRYWSRRSVDVLENLMNENR